MVESGETVFSDGLIQNFELGDVTVNPVAQGVDLTATNTFGPENEIIPLNLNASMADAADATVPGAVDASQEMTTLKLTGLGEFASFYIGADQKVGGLSYDAATDTYTLSGLSQTDLDELGFVQARDALTDQDGAASAGGRLDIGRIASRRRHRVRRVHLAGRLHPSGTARPERDTGGLIDSSGSSGFPGRPPIKRAIAGARSSTIPAGARVPFPTHQIERPP